MDKRTELFDLDEDILYLILTQLQNISPASLLKFTNASRECEKLAGPILYGSITLSDKGDEKTQLQTRQLFKRLLSKDDPINNYVKELNIVEWGEEVDHSRSGIPTPQAPANPDSLHFPFDTSKIRNGDSKLLPSSGLEHALENLRSLESFGWDAKSMIPQGVISKLEGRHPSARLYATNNRRDNKTSDSPMDVRLLSSPLLYSLNYSIFYGTTPSGIVCSEFRKLKEILVQSSKLNLLSLAVYPTDLHDIDIPKAPGDWHSFLPVGSGDPLWKLHTLKIPNQITYNVQPISKVYSTIFSQSNDFTQVNRINLNNVCGYYSFEPLKGRVPNLKHLELAFRTEDPARRRWDTSHLCRDPSLVRQFIESINGLEILQITNYQESFDILWPAILKHRGTLQRLSIHTPPDKEYKRNLPPVLSVDQMEQLQESKISHIALDVLIVDITWFSNSDTDLNKLELDPSTALCLAGFTRFESLKVYIELPIDASVFSEVYNPIAQGDSVPPLIEEKAEEVAIGLFQQIYANDPKASLRELEVCFCRLEKGDRVQSHIVHSSLWVRKAEIDYINNPSAPGWEVQFQREWEYQDSLMF